MYYTISVYKYILYRGVRSLKSRLTGNVSHLIQVLGKKIRSSVRAAVNISQLSSLFPPNLKRYDNKLNEWPELGPRKTSKRALMVHWKFGFQTFVQIIILSDLESYTMSVSGMFVYRKHKLKYLQLKKQDYSNPSPMIKKSVCVSGSVHLSVSV